MPPLNPQTHQQTQGNIPPFPPTPISSNLSPANTLPKWLWRWIGILMMGGGGIGGLFLILTVNSGTPNIREIGEIPVNLVTVTTAKIEESTEFIGNLEVGRSQIIKPPTSGIVTQVFVQPGERIPKGTPMFQIDPQGLVKFVSSPQKNHPSVVNSNSNFDNQLATISVLEAEQASRRADVNFYQRQFDKYTKLVAQGEVSGDIRDNFLRKLKTAQTKLAQVESKIQLRKQNRKQNPNPESSPPPTYYIKAPFTGNLLSLQTKVGDIINRDDQLATLTQTSPLKLQIYIPANRREQLRPGMTIQILNDQGKPVGTSRVVTIANHQQNSQESILVTAIYQNSSAELEAPNFIRTRIIWKSYPGVLIPRNAVNAIAKEPFVYVSESQPQNRFVARQRKVKLGSLQGDNYQIQDGLQPGEKVIVSNLARLRDGEPISIVKGNGE
ncbi:efflux RND transporter periplasmic adaptor subunit [Calothrix sp. NIES-3974]|uniref:efflux RND transporter periplasmic adaptor subunit n=1 Tax=Calothrix sp. NIES-3974 TaxID=2005462 RepID=UPI000B612799|nr:efflux RND transporter periplasmic adaptor subunit [Calothrix sp. NIES-3974]BAZ05551.1 secretion protein HlyD [Calothrix sp. NIES-3974]